MDALIHIFFGALGLLVILAGAAVIIAAVVVVFNSGIAAVNFPSRPRHSVAQPQNREAVQETYAERTVEQWSRECSVVMTPMGTHDITLEERLGMEGMNGCDPVFIEEAPPLLLEDGADVIRFEERRLK